MKNFIERIVKCKIIFFIKREGKRRLEENYESRIKYLIKRSNLFVEERVLNLSFVNQFMYEDIVLIMICSDIDEKNIGKRWFDDS